MFICAFNSKYKYQKTLNSKAAEGFIKVEYKKILHFNKLYFAICIKD